jgi:hypothetical protein
MERIRIARRRNAFAEDCMIIRPNGGSANISHLRIDPLDGKARKKPSKRSIRC